MDNKTKDAIKQLQSELRQLQTAMNSARFEAKVNAAPSEVSAPGKKDWVVQCVIYPPAAGEGADAKKETVSASAAQLARVTGEAAAAVGYALASPQKVALLRALLGKVSEGAAELGELTHLSTGSLYHHLRELMRAGLVHQAGRNRYELTERGARTLLVVLALAME